MTNEIQTSASEVDGVRGKGLTVPIDSVGADLLPANVADQIAIANQQLKERIAKDIMRFMGVSLGVTLTLTLILSGVDATFIAFDLIKPTERLITENVVMAVIGATVVQVGAASIAIVYSLFGRPKGDEGE